MTATVQTIERGSTRLTRIADEVARIRRRRAADDAAEMRLLAEAQDVALAQMGVPSLDDGPRDIPLRSAAASLAVVSRVADRTVQARINAAWTMRNHFPATLNALMKGRIDRAHASVIADAGVHLPDEASRARFEDQILPVAERETPNRLRPIAQLVAQRIHPVPIDERHAAAAKRRRIWKTPDVDGMGEFGMYGPMTTIEAVYQRATALGLTVIEARAAAKKTAGGGSSSSEQGGPDTISGLGDAAEPVEPDRRMRSGST